MNPILKNFILMLFTMFAVFMIGEGVSRYFLDKRIYIKDPVLHHALSPNLQTRQVSALGEFDVKVSMNSHGHNDYEFPQAKPHGTFRALFLGDSFPEGLSVEQGETFPKQLEDLLRERQKGTYQVINAAVASYSPALEYLYLKEKGLGFSPDLVVVTFFPNDVTDDFKYSLRMDYDSENLPLKAHRAPPTGVKGFLKEHSALYYVIKTNILKVLVSFGMKKPVPFGAANPSDDLTSNFFAIFKEEYNESEIKLWNLSKRFLLGIQKLCKKHGAKMLLVIIPIGNQVSPDEWKIGKGVHQYKPDSMITSTKMQQVLLDFGRDHNIPTLDLLPGFREAAKTQRLYFDYDGHWNVHGHALAAEETYRFLVSKKLIKNFPHDK